VISSGDELALLAIFDSVVSKQVSNVYFTNDRRICDL